MFKYWYDDLGRKWKVTQSKRRLKFKIPCHAAMRRFIFIRDGFKCVRCGAQGMKIPLDYDGKNTLCTNTYTSTGFNDLLILDHIITLNAGGKNIITNFQTLCETCNKRKIKEDNINSRNHKESLKNG